MAGVQLNRALSPRRFNSGFLSFFQPPTTVPQCRPCNRLLYSSFGTFDHHNKCVQLRLKRSEGNKKKLRGIPDFNVCGMRTYHSLLPNVGVVNTLGWKICPVFKCHGAGNEVKVNVFSSEVFARRFLSNVAARRSKISGSMRDVDIIIQSGKGSVKTRDKVQKQIKETASKLETQAVNNRESVKGLEAFGKKKQTPKKNIQKKEVLLDAAGSGEAKSKSFNHSTVNDDSVRSSQFKTEKKKVKVETKQTPAKKKSSLKKIITLDSDVMPTTERKITFSERGAGMSDSHSFNNSTKKMPSEESLMEPSEKKSGKSTRITKVQTKKSHKVGEGGGLSPVGELVKGSSDAQQTLEPLYPPSGKSVVVVESLTKARVIQNYLGEMFEVISSNGHVRDLAGRSGSVRPDDDFSMVWEVPTSGWTQLKSIKVALNGAKNLILASDPDREGEAIAWHIIEMLHQQDSLPEGISVVRVVFHEITEAAIKSALQSPRHIDTDLVNAYMARRALDYLIGFNISPLLWKKLPGCQSAGRVQSAALGLLCDREFEIEEFKPQEYWTVEAEFYKKDGASDDDIIPFSSQLTHVNSSKLDKLSIQSRDEAQSIQDTIMASQFKVLDCRINQLQRNPPTPYITSSLQQDAANKLHFSAARTMQLAQKLYEGVIISGGETTGLITYMRTDGFHMSEGAVKNIQSLIVERYGSNYASTLTKHYKKVKNAQEAHEAIRPTDIARLPSTLADVLDEDSLKLYTLIWSRTVACQMSSACIQQVQVKIGNDEGIVMGAGASKIIFPGYRAVYKDREAADISRLDTEEITCGDAFTTLSALRDGDFLAVRKLETNQHHTVPLPRYSEGSLIKKLEELGIGRPSTYSAIIKVLKDRKYVTVNNRALIPEFRGRMVSAFLSDHFSEVSDYSFTADMENELDNVSVGRTQWKGLLKDYWTRFSMYCERALKVDRRKVEQTLGEKFGFFLFSSLPEKSRTCPGCGKGTLTFKVSKFGAGYFIGCDQHPTCKYIARTVFSYNEAEVEVDEDKLILPERAIDSKPRCIGLSPTNEQVLVKSGPFGSYVQLGDDKKGNRPKRAALVGLKDPKTVTLEYALELLRYPISLGNHPESNQPVMMKVSKMGFGVSHGRTFAYVPKRFDHRKVTLDYALKLLSSKHAKQLGRPKNAKKVEDVLDAIFTR